MYENHFMTNSVNDYLTYIGHVVLPDNPPTRSRKEIIIYYNGILFQRYLKHNSISTKCRSELGVKLNFVINCTVLATY